MSKEKATKSTVLMLSSSDGMQSGRSGYTTLSEYVRGAQLSAAQRSDSNRLPARIAAKLVSQFSVSRWYRPESAILELRGLLSLARGFEGPLHLLWGDRDLGYLDGLCRAFRHRLCCTFHACPDTLPSVIQFPRRVRSLSAIVLMSRSQHSFFGEAGVPLNRIHVVLHGVDTAYFRPAPRAEGQDFTVLVVGSYRRDFDRLYEICSRLRDQPGLVFRIVAPSRVHDRLPKFDNTTLVSRLTDAELRGEYQRAGCLLMPVESATANNAVLEAMACGLPIIADAVDGIPEYTGKHSGILVESREPDDFVRAIRALQASPATQREMSLGARERAEQLDWSLVGPQMTEIYRTCA